MPSQIAAARAARTGLAAAIVVLWVAVVPWAAPAGAAQPATTATIVASLSPNRLGARAALTFDIRFAGGQFGVPDPVRRSVLRLPAGLSLDIPRLSSCTPRRLREAGASGCPPQSEIGTGRAFVETHAGSLTLSEDVTLWAFLGPPHNLQPTFEILGQGYTPLDERVVFTGTTLPDRLPYGEQLVMSIPAIPTLRLEPDASLVDFSLTIGVAPRRLHDLNAVVVPANCPAGGFPFAAGFTYADGSKGRAIALAPCP